MASMLIGRARQLAFGDIEGSSISFVASNSDGVAVFIVGEVDVVDDDDNDDDIKIVVEGKSSK